MHGPMNMNIKQESITDISRYSNFSTGFENISGCPKGFATKQAMESC